MSRPIILFTYFSKSIELNVKIKALEQKMSHWWKVTKLTQVFWMLRKEKAIKKVLKNNRMIQKYFWGRGHFFLRWYFIISSLLPDKTKRMIVSFFLLLFYHSMVLHRSWLQLAVATFRSSRCWWRKVQKSRLMTR